MANDFFQNIYNNDDLLNQYLLNTDGYFLYFLEEHVQINTERLLSLGNPLVFNYLWTNKKLGFFFSENNYSFNNFNLLKRYQIEPSKNLINSLEPFFDINFNNNHPILATPFFLLSKTAIFNTALFNKYKNENEKFKLNINTLPNTKLLNSILKEDIPSTQILSDYEVDIISLFYVNYQSFKQKILNNDILQNNSTLNNLYSYRKEFIHKFENEHFYTTIELLIHNFYQNNQHLDYLPTHISKLILQLQQKFNTLNIQKFPVSSINSKKAIFSKNISLDMFLEHINKCNKINESWSEDPLKTYSLLNTEFNNYIPLNIDYLPNTFLPNKNTNSQNNNIQGDFVNFIYQSVDSFTEQLNILLSNKKDDPFSPSNDLKFSNYLSNINLLSDELINSFIQNKIFFFSSTKKLTTKPLIINKKTLKPLLSLNKDYLFEKSTLIRFISTSLDEINSSSLFIQNNLSQFEQDIISFHTNIENIHNFNSLINPIILNEYQQLNDTDKQLISSSNLIFSITSNQLTNTQIDCDINLKFLQKHNLNVILNLLEQSNYKYNFIYEQLIPLLLSNNKTHIVCYTDFLNAIELKFANKNFVNFFKHHFDIQKFDPIEFNSKLIFISSDQPDNDYFSPLVLNFNPINDQPSFVSHFWSLNITQINNLSSKLQNDFIQNSQINTSYSNQQEANQHFSNILMQIISLAILVDFFSTHKSLYHIYSNSIFSPNKILFVNNVFTSVKILTENIPFNEFYSIYNSKFKENNLIKILKNQKDNKTIHKKI